MANFFDQLDGAPATPPPAPPGGGREAPPTNFFDQFDAPAPSRGASSTDLGAALHGAREQPGSGPIVVDHRDPDAAQRAWDTVTGAVQPSRTESFVRGARQGAGMNFGDEARGLAEASGLPGRGLIPGAQIVGAARLAGEYLAPGVFGHSATDRYNETVSQERASDHLAEKTNPGTYLTGELTGGLATAAATPALAPFRAAEGAGLVARGAAATGNMAATGGAYGAVAGAGAGEGDPIDRLASAATGAAVGAALAPAIGGVVAGGGAAGRFVADHVRASRDPQALADRVVSRNLARDAAGEPMLPGGDTVGNAPSAVARMEEARAAGQPLTLADATGPNTQGLAGQVARQPGEGRAQARQFLEDRQIGTEMAPGQGDRVSDQLGRVLSDKSMVDTGEAILTRRSAEADPMYRRANSVRLDYGKPDGQELLSLLDRVPNAAKAEANNILKISDREGHQIIWDPVPNDAGQFTLRTAPNMAQWGYIKQALDTSISGQKNPITGQLTPLGGALQGLKTEILSRLDALNPAYKAARDRFAGHSELLDALRSGADAFKPSTTPEVITKVLDGLSAGERDMYRLAASNALRDTLANAGDGVNKVRLAYGSPALRQKLAAIAPDQASRDALHGFLKNEGAMYATRQRATGGSPTAERLDEGADTAALVNDGLRFAHGVVRAASGHVGTILAETAKHMAKVNPELRGQVLNEARKIILNPDPTAVRAWMDRVGRAEMKDGTRQRVIAAVSRGLPRALTTSAVGP